MKLSAHLSRLTRPAAVCAASLLLATAAAAASHVSPYTMTEFSGFVCVVDGETGALLYRSDVPVDMLSQRDQLLLEAGIPLETQADFTRALEDFCS